MALRKIDLMHSKFGKDETHTCGECSNFEVYVYRDKRYRKCAVYGVTMSEASDWTKKYIACGMFGKSYDGRNIIEFVRGNHSAQRVIEQIPGQMMMEDE